MYSLRPQEEDGGWRNYDNPWVKTTDDQYGVERFKCTLQMTTDLTHWQALASRSVPDFRTDYEYYWPMNLRAFAYKRYRRESGRMLIAPENLYIPLTHQPPTTLEGFDMAIQAERIVHIQQTNTDDEETNVKNTPL